MYLPLVLSSLVPPSIFLFFFLNYFVNPLAITHPRTPDTFTLSRISKRGEEGVSPLESRIYKPLHTSTVTSVFLLRFSEEEFQFYVGSIFRRAATILDVEVSRVSTTDCRVSRCNPRKSIRNRRCAPRRFATRTRLTVFACFKITTTFAGSETLSDIIKSLSSRYIHH